MCRLGDDSYSLRLENLDIFNGPDLYVYVVAAGNVTDDEAVLEDGFLNIGWLKGNRGDQTYVLPRNFESGEHRAISVWCWRFSVNFATAPLRQAWPAIIRKGTGKAVFGWRRSWS
ncbi:MAG TPA: DM13 domain-containing protein [Rubrobacter sp.]|nr:DM13 domain-containing protein [Rubrobacter sp.]